MVFLRISPWKGVLRFGKRGKLSPRYIGPYRIVETIGEVAYRLELPSNLDHIRCFPCFYAPQVHTRPFTCIDRAASGNTGKFDIRRGTSVDPRSSRASSVQQNYSVGEGIVEESYSRGSYMGA